MRFKNYQVEKGLEMRLELKYFGSSEQIRMAQLSEIKKVKGINKNVAKKIYNFFHEN